jgi:hypothetical protein
MFTPGDAGDIANAIEGPVPGILETDSRPRPTRTMIVVKTIPYGSAGSVDYIRFEGPDLAYNDGA